MVVDIDAHKPLIGFCVYIEVCVEKTEIKIKKCSLLYKDERRQIENNDDGGIAYGKTRERRSLISFTDKR